MTEELTNDEKFSLMIKIMEDLRGDWSRNWDDRANKVRELATQLGHEKTVKLVNEYFEGIAEHADPDGRHFRTSWEHSGGYEEAPDPLAKNDSLRKVFIRAIMANCNYPENRLGGGW